MKKPYLVKKAICLLMIVGTFSCAEKGMGNLVDEPNIDETKFSVMNARKFFESVIVSRLEGYSETNYIKSPFYPGDYTPIWDNAVKKQYVDRIVIATPILMSRNITAVCASFSGNKSFASVSAVNQSLVIEKNTDDIVRIYIRSVIADNTCSKLYGARSAVKFTDPFVKDFSGVICNYSLSGKLINVEHIRQGAVTKRAKADSKLIKAIFATAGIGRLINVAKLSQTRFGGEDDTIGADGMTNEEWIDASRPGDWGDAWDGIPDNNDVESSIIIKVYCPKCKAYLGSILIENWGDEAFYCRSCNIICS